MSLRRSPTTHCHWHVTVVILFRRRFALAPSPCSVVVCLLFQRPPALSSVCLFFHRPPALSSSVCSFIVPLLCLRLSALSSSPTLSSSVCSFIVPLLCRLSALPSPPAVLWLPCVFIVYNYVLTLRQRIKSTTPVSICLCLLLNLSSFSAHPSPIIHPAGFSLS